MKILFAADGNTEESNISKRFGHAAYYIIYNTDSGKFVALQNNGHDDEHSSLAALVNEGIEVFVVGNIGPNAFNVLTEQNAKIYIARKRTVNEALENFLNGELKELEQATLKRSIEEHDHVGSGLHKHHLHGGDGEHHYGGGYGRHGGGRGLGRGLNLN